MGTSGRIRSWHGPGPGPHAVRQPWRASSGTMTFSRPSEGSHTMSVATKNTNSRAAQGRTSGATLTFASRWLLVVVLLVSSMSMPADAACSGLSCPTGCACSDVGTSGSCRVDCSSVTGITLGSLSSSATPVDKVTELILSSCSITSVPVNAFQSFTNLVKLDLAGNSIATLDPSVFHNLTNLEVLILQGNKLQSLPTNIFAGRRKLVELYLSSNSLYHMDINIFSDLDALQVLNLDNNAFAYLPVDLFEGKPNLTKINLSGNAWRCDCVLGALVSWTRQGSRQLLDLGKTKCSQPAALSNSPWPSLNPTQLPCDPSALMSCFHDDQKGVSKPVFLQHSVATAASDIAECDLACASRGLTLGVFQQDGLCLCGLDVTTSSPSCSCPPSSSSFPASGSTLCSKTYVNGAFQAHLGLLLAKTKPTPSQSNAQLGLTGAIANFSMVWDFGDTTANVTQFSLAGIPLSHNFPLGGVYNITVEVPGSGAVLQWPHHVLDPIGPARLVVSRYADVAKHLQIQLELDQGTDVGVRWSLFDSKGNQVFGKRCSFGWYQHRVHTCIQPTILQTTINSTAATDMCADENAKLLYFNSYNELNKMKNLLSTELAAGNVVLIGVKKLDNVSYEWIINQKKTFFNTSMVVNSEEGDCVGLAANGLVGVNCSNVQSFVCRKGQVFCEHGGVEWEKRSCVVPLGSDTPLSQSDAESACQSIRGHLATIDSQQKEEFIQQNAMSNFGSPSVWLGLNDHHVSHYYIWPTGSSLDTHKPWAAGSPVPSSPSAKMCVAMVTSGSTTSWKSTKCTEKMAYMCEYPTEEQVPQVQNFLSGVGRLTVTNTTVMTLTPTSENITTMTELLLIPGNWFQHAGRVQSFRLSTLASTASAKFRLQVYRPVCDSGQFLVPPGCSKLPTPFASCTSTATSCTTTPPSCSQGQQFCPLINKCLPIFDACTCAALDTSVAIGCSNTQYTSQAQITSQALNPDSYRYNGDMPKFMLVGEVEVAPSTLEKGLFNINASGIEVEPNDILGVQFISGDYKLLCETTTSDMDAADYIQSILSLSLPKNPVMEKVDANGAIWLDSMVCNIQAVSTTPTEVEPPKNLVDKSVLSVGDSIYRVTLYSQAGGSIVYDTTVTLQKSVSSIIMANPDPKLQSGGSKMAVVEALASEYLLWYIKKGTDPSANWTIPNSSPTFSDSCPSSLNSLLDDCAKDYQFLSHRLTAGPAGNRTTIVLNVWNKISSQIYLVDILAQERLSDLTISPMSITEYVPGKTISIYSTIQTGSHIQFEWDFGDGATSTNTKANETHIYSGAGIYTIALKASNGLNSKSTSTILKLVTRANVKNLAIQADSEVDRHSDFPIDITATIDPKCSVTVYVDFGDGSSKTITKPEIQNTNAINIQLNQKYPLGNTYTIKVYVIDNLYWDRVTPIVSLIGQAYVSYVEHTVQAFTVLPGLVVSSSPECHATNEQVPFSVSFPTGYSKSSYSLDWDFGDGQKISQFEVNSAKHPFSSPGTYNVELNIKNNDTKASATYKKCIEENIFGLTLAPTPRSTLAISRGQSASTQFAVSVVTGSGLQYWWIYDGKTSQKNPGTFRSVFATHGVYDVKLNVSNHISSEVKTTKVTVEEIITGLDITHNGTAPYYFIVNELYDFQAASSTGSNIAIKWDITNTAGKPTVTSILNKVQMSWSNNGLFSVSVRFSNLVGQETRAITASVEMPITSVTITASDNTETNKTLTIMAEALGGVDEQTMQYAWILCITGESTCTPLTDVTKTLTTTPTKSGSYNYTLIASNHVSSVSESKIVQVWSKLAGLAIELDAQDISNDYAIKGNDIDFKATVQEGTGDYSWNLTGGSTTLRGTGEEFTVNLSEEVIYELYLTASNPINSVTVKYTFRVQEAIEGLEILSLLGDIAYIDELLKFRVAHSTGSFIRFKWELFQPDGTAQLLTQISKTDVSRVFNTKGIHTLSVTATNKVTQITVTLSVQIRDPDITYKVTMDYDSRPYIHQYIPITASIVGPLKNATQIRWRIYDQFPPTEVNSTTITRNFTERAEYTIEARFTADFKLVVIRYSVFVQGQLPPVTLTLDKYILETNGTVRFVANVQNHVDDLQYRWLIGTEPPITTNSSVLNLRFPDPGIVFVQVYALNKVSFSEANAELIVQSPIGEVMLMNGYYYNTTQSTKLIAGVSVGTDVTYTWSISPLVQHVQSVQSGKQIQLTFPSKRLTSVGTYSVTINASNLVSTKVKTIIIEVQDPVSQVNFVHAPGEVYVGQFVEFTATADGSDISYHWVLFNITLNGNSFDEQVGPSNSFPQNFTNQGIIYVLSVQAFNNVSSTSTFKFITAYVIRCVPMKLTAIGGNTRTELLSRSLWLEVAVDTDCTRYPIIYNWTVYRECKDEVKIANVTQPQLILPPRTLKYGNYCIKFTAWYERTPVIIDLQFDVTIKESDLVARIDGGSETYVSVIHSILISGDGSYDPDLTLGSLDRKIKYSWTILSATCPGSPLLGPETTSQVVIAPGKFKPDCTYDVTLTVSKDGRKEVNTTQKIVTTSLDPPLVVIRCMSCAASDQFSQFSNGLPIKLYGSCPNCKGTSVSFNWTVIKSDGSEIDLTSDVGLSTTGGKQANMVIRQGSFSTDNSYTFRLEIKDKDTFDVHGYAKLTMRPNLPPAGGLCNVENKNNTVIASEENLDIACKNWTDPDGSTSNLLLYQVHIVSLKSSKDSYLLYSGPKARGSYSIAPFYELEEEVLVTITISDKDSSKTMALSQRIRIIVQSNGDELLKKLNERFPVLVLHQTPKELLQFSIALTKQLNFIFGISGDSSDSKEVWVAMRGKIIKALTGMNFAETLEDMQQLGYLLKQLTNVSLRFPLSIETCKAILELVDNMVSWMRTQVTAATNNEDIVPDSILDVINNVISGLKVPDNSQPTNGSTTTDLTPALILSLTEEFLKKIPLITDAYASSTITGEKAFQYFNEMGLAVGGQQVFSANIQTEISFDGCVVKIPKDLLLHLGIPNEESVLQMVMALSSNPLRAGENASNNDVTSKILGLHFKYNNGTDINVSNLDKDHLIEMTMPLSEDDVSRQTSTGNTSSVFSPNAAFKTSFNTSHFALGGLNIEIVGNVIPNENETSEEVSDKLRLIAYLGYGFEPSWYLFNKTLAITSNSTNHMDYTFFTTIDKSTASSIYVTVTNNGPAHKVNVSVHTYEVQCQYYSFSRSSWSTYGCNPTRSSNRSHTTCHCNHLTIFGASSLVSPGDIDFSDLTRLNLADNPVVLILVAVIAGIFIVVVFWARQYDLQDLHNISIVPLCGRDGLYKYEVVVITGRRRGAGTSAHVGIKLYGDESKSGARHLYRLGAFQRTSEDSFLVATQVSLGIVHKVHIWHDNTGKRPSWYVKRVMVRDLQTNKKTYFLVDEWLSLTMEKGSLDKQVFSASQEQLSNFGTVFHSETSRGFAERHVWMSIWDRPPRSRFTRVQRVVCCATLLYSFMCANVMWYGLINNKDRVTQALGLVSIGWQEFVVGILASIVVFPLNFLIIQIFRFTKVKLNAYDYSMKPGTAQTIEVEAMCDMSQAGDSFIAYDRKNSVVPLRRESSTDSIMVPIESRKWWSYDTILKWPEKMPSDPRPESGMAGPLKKRSALRTINTPHDIDSDELIIDDDTLRDKGGRLRHVNNNNKRMPITTTSGTLSISQSIAEIEEDVITEEAKPECSRKYESVPMNTLQVPSSSSGYESVERTDSWSTGLSGQTAKGSADDKNGVLTPDAAGIPKLDSDSGEVHQALMEIDTNIKESNLIEPRLLNRKKSSMNQGNTPHIDILRLDEFGPEFGKEALDEDLSDLAGLEPKGGLRKTKSKTRVSKRWAQIVIPPEYETYKNEHFKIFDPEDDYDAISLNRSNTLKSRGSSISNSTTSSSRFHQLMPSSTSTVRWLLPHWCIYIAYSLCFIVSGISIIVTILYGHSFGTELALKWLLAFFISFLDSVFILEPLKVLALAVFVALLTRGLQEEDEGIETRPVIESNEKIKDIRMKPIGGFALLQAREEGHNVQRMHRLLRHFCVYMIFIWIAFFITYRAHNTSIFPISQDVENTLLVPTTSTGTGFNDIRRPEEFWSWMNEVAAPALHPDEKDITNTQRILLGQVRLRQIRSHQVTCQVRAALISLSAAAILDHGCYGNPGWQEDTNSYEAGWLATSSNATWKYYTPQQALGENYEGVVSSYGGGGYVQKLGATLHDAQTALTSLAQANWTDRETRAVFMEANLYTVPTHLHTTVRILAEFPVSGGVWMSKDVQTLQLQNHVPGQVTAIMIFMAFLAIIWFYLLSVVLTGFRRHMFRYFLEFWHCMELTVMVIVLGVLATYIHRVVIDTASHSRHAMDPKGFNSFFQSMAVFRVWKSISGILVFILTAWMVRALRFIKPFSAYGQTIRVAAPKLVGCVLILVLFIFSLSHLGHLWFGSLMGSFRSLGSSFMTVYGLLRARSVNVVGSMHDLSPAMAGFMVFTFISTVMVAGMGVFMAILNSTYKMVRLQTYYRNSMDMPDYEMIDFIMKRFKKYIGVTKPKPAFRRVKFQGMPSLSDRSSISSRTGMSQSMASSGSYDPFGLDALITEEGYLEDLLDRCVPTWTRMLAKLERVLWLDREVTRLETALMEALGSFMKVKRKLPIMPRLRKMKRAAGRIIGSRGSRCHRSNSESLMTDIRAQQIRDALNAELQEMEEKIIADTEKPSLQRKPKSVSFTEAGETKDIDSLAEYEMEILGEDEDDTDLIHVAEGQPQSRPNGNNERPPTGQPPSQPKRFLNSAGPRRTFHEAGSTSMTKESPAAVRRQGSASSSSRHRPGPSSTVVKPGTQDVRDATPGAQKAYCTKLPRRDIKIPGLKGKSNFHRRPTSEQSERVKKNPDIALPKPDPES